MSYALLFGILFAAGLFIVFMSFDRGTAVADEHIEQRLKGYGEIGPVTLDEIELQKTFDERVLRPNLERIGRFLTDRTPQKSRDSLRSKLSLAGNPGNLSVGGFQALRDVAAGLGVILGGLLGLLVGRGSVGLVLGIAVGALVGFYAPMYWINSLAGSRRAQIQKGLPDAMDLLTI